MPRRKVAVAAVGSPPLAAAIVAWLLPSLPAPLAAVAASLLTAMIAYLVPDRRPAPTRDRP